MIDHRQYLRNAVGEVGGVFLVGAEPAEEFDIGIGDRRTLAVGDAVFGLDAAQVQLGVAIGELQRIVKHVGRSSRAAASGRTPRSGRPRSARSFPAPRGWCVDTPGVAQAADQVLDVEARRRQIHWPGA